MNSYFFELINNFLFQSQNSKAGKFCSDSIFFINIDAFIFIFIALTLIFSTFASTNALGFLMMIIIALSFMKLLFKNGSKVEFTKMDIWITVYYLIVVVSLCASSDFMLSLHGFLKMLVYWLLYYSLTGFFKGNKNKFLPLLVLISLLCSIESIIGIIQNHAGVLAISGWQDTSKLDTTEVLSRCYGTLQPYNPNLLAGYLIAAIPSTLSLCAICYYKGYFKRALTFCALLFLSILAIFYTGCRGAYLALFGMSILLYISLYKYTNGFSNIKKRVKTLILAVGASLMCVIVLMPPIFKRILSIFAMRGDSSTSFRMNVYESSFKMFLDNPFLGIGVGNQNFREVYGLYMMTGFDALGAYSVPLEIAVESGIFALIAFVLFMVKAVQKCLNIIKNTTSKVRMIIAFSILLMITGVMLHGAFDTIYFRPQVQFIFWLNIALLNSLFIK